MSGCATALKETHANIQVHGVEPEALAIIMPHAYLVL